MTDKLSERIRAAQEYEPPLAASEVLLRDTCGQWADEVAALEQRVEGLEEGIEDIRTWAQTTSLKALHPEILLVVDRMCDNVLAADNKTEDWYCPTCDAYISGETVTFEEVHEVCGTSLAALPEHLR